MKFHLIVLVVILIRAKFSCCVPDSAEGRTFGGLLRRDRTSTTTTTARSVISEKKIEEEEDEDKPKEIPQQVKPPQGKRENSNEKPNQEKRVFIEDRTFGRDGLKNIMLGGVVVAVINIAPVILSGLKTVVNLALPILGLLLFRQHRSFRYFDDFMDLLEEYTNNAEDELDDENEQDKEVIKNEEYYPPQNYPYDNYDYYYYNTNPYRAYGY